MARSSDDDSIYGQSPDSQGLDDSFGEFRHIDNHGGAGMCWN